VWKKEQDALSPGLEKVHAKTTTNVRSINTQLIKMWIVHKTVWSNFSHNGGKHSLRLHVSEPQHHCSKPIHAKKKVNDPF